MLQSNLTLIGNPSAGGVQGYNLLGKHLQQRGCRIKGWRGDTMQRFGVKALRRFPRYRGLSPPSAWELFTAECSVRRARNDCLIHFLWGDEFWRRFSRPSNAIFTIHQPIELWPRGGIPNLLQARGIITMADREAVELSKQSDTLPVRFIAHGIDLAFWQPATTTLPDTPKVIAVVGRYLRNFGMLMRVAKQLLGQRRDVQFRWLLNPDFELPEALARQLPLERFQIIRGLSAEALRQFYQESWLFFTPYENVAASNAIVEALACGVPVFTTRVGGMEGYCSDGGAVLVSDNDDDAMMKALNRCLDDRTLQSKLATEARQAAQRSFSWQQVVEAHLEFYRSVRVRVQGNEDRRQVAGA